MRTSQLFGQWLLPIALPQAVGSQGEPEHYSGRSALFLLQAAADAKRQYQVSIERSGDLFGEINKI
jgi:hypothetical protein